MAGEYAILSNGFRLHAERHEKAGTLVRLYTAQGVTELPQSLVAGFEKEEFVPPPPAPAPDPRTVSTGKPALSPKQLVDKAAQQAFDNDRFKKLTHAVARAESAYRVDAVSPKGAVGIMQLMPGTAAQLQKDARDPEQNTEAGAQYLADLLVKYNGDVVKAVAAYNAGPGAVDRFNGVPPYRETRTYVNRVIKNYKQLGGD
jgi:soluble lytic murein transglycosylase-like protein